MYKFSVSTEDLITLHHHLVTAGADANLKIRFEDVEGSNPREGVDIFPRAFAPTVVLYVFLTSEQVASLSVASLDHWTRKHFEGRE